MREGLCVALEPWIRRWADAAHSARRSETHLPQALRERLRGVLENIERAYTSPMDPISG